MILATNDNKIDNKIGLIHIVKYLFRVYHHINLNPGGIYREDASAR